MSHQPVGAEMPPPAVLIRQVEGRVPEVLPIHNFVWSELASSHGLLIYADRGREAWHVLPTQSRNAEASDALTMVSRFGARSNRAALSSPNLAAWATVQLDQIIGQALVRGEGFLTPPHGARLLNPQVTIRRSPAIEGEQLPPLKVELVDGTRTLALFEFVAGQQMIAWADIANLPDELHAGLPPGEYTLRGVDSSESVTFTIEPAEIREWVMELPDELSDRLDSREDALYLHVATAHLMNQVDESGKPIPYVADALDLLESVPQEQLTPYLTDLHRQILRQLSGRPEEKLSPNIASPPAIPDSMQPVRQAEDIHVIRHFLRQITEYMQ